MIETSHGHVLLEFSVIIIAHAFFIYRFLVELETLFSLSLHVYKKKKIKRRKKERESAISNLGHNG